MLSICMFQIVLPRYISIKKLGHVAMMNDCHTACPYEKPHLMPAISVKHEPSHMRRYTKPNMFEPNRYVSNITAYIS